MRRVCAALLLAAAPAAASLFGCRQTVCATTCANCAPTEVTPFNTCASGTANCGDPSTDSSGWAAGCYKYAKIENDGDSAAGCDGIVSTIVGPSFVVGLVAAGLGLLICLFWPCFRCLCNCCGGNTVNTDSCCSGQPNQVPCCGNGCSQPDAVKASETESAQEYFEKGCKWINPCHPYGARFVLPLFTIVLVCAAVALGISGAELYLKAVDDVFKTFDSVIDSVLGNPVTYLSSNLTSSTTCTIYTDTSNGKTQTMDADYTSITTTLTTIVNDAKAEIDKINKDADDVRDIVRGVVTAFALMPVPAAVMVVLSAFCRCGRVATAGCRGGCFGGGCCIHLQTFCCILPLLFLIGVCLAMVGVIASFNSQFCDDINDMGSSPPVLTGFVANNMFEPVCEASEFMTEIGNLYTLRNAARTGYDTANGCTGGDGLTTGGTDGSGGSCAYATCQEFENAMDLLRGRPSRAVPRGSEYEGLVDCRRMFYATGVGLDGLCSDLVGGSKNLVAGMWMGVFSMVFAFISTWLGYKRWINQEDIGGIKDDQGKWVYPARVGTGVAGARDGWVAADTAPFGGKDGGMTTKPVVSLAATGDAVSPGTGSA